MSLTHAILGFLSLSPFSGYDLKKAFDSSVRHFWPADQSQIYRTLAQIVEAGWAEVEVVPQKEHPDQKIYHLTKAGRAELHQWLANPLPSRESREPLLIQLFFASSLSNGELNGLLQHEVAQTREQLAQLEQIPRADKKSMTRRRFFTELTLDYGLKIGQAHLEWVEDVIKRVKKAPTG